MYAFVFFLLGAIIGSFLNVVILRLHTGRSLKGRSHCMSCGTELGALDLVPLVSYLALRGRCRSCGARFTMRYALVEAATGGLFALMALSEPDLFSLVLKLVIVSILVVIFFYDLAHLIIPDELTGLLVVPAALLAAWDRASGSFGWPPLSALAAAALVFLFFWGLWRASRGRWMGLGDAKLAAPLALALGAAAAPLFVVGAFWLGALVGVLLLLAGRLAARQGTTRLSFRRIRLTMKSEVPFAPFLIASYLLVAIFHADIFTFTTRFFPGF